MLKVQECEQQMTHLVAMLKCALEASRKAIEVTAKQAKIALINAIREGTVGKKFNILTADEVEDLA